MRQLNILVCIFGLLFIITPSAKAEVTPEPEAKKIPKVLKRHGDERIDNYYWLRNRKDSEVIKYLEDENLYTDSFMSQYENEQENIFKEMKSRIRPEDQTAPYYDNGFFYYRRTFADKDYPIYYRKKGSLDKKEDILLDVNDLADDHKFTSVWGLKVSPDNKTLAYAHDTVGRRIFTIYFKDLNNDSIHSFNIPKSTGNFQWSADSKYLFYVKQDPTTLRASELFRFSLSTKKSQKIYTEKDDTFSIWLGESKSKRYLFLVSGSTETNETRFIKSDSPNASWRIFQKRQKGVKFGVYDGLSKFYLRTNLNASNYQIMETDLRSTKSSKWKTVVPHSSKKYITNLQVFKSHIFYVSKENSISKLKSYDRRKKKTKTFKFNDPAYTVGFYKNPIYDSNTIMLSYESLTTPRTVYKYSLDGKTKSIVYRKKVPGGYDPSQYISKRVFAKAKDGSKIPMSIVYKKSVKRNGKNPALIYGYGSYGAIIEPRFSTTRLSLLERGFVFAIAHVRGGAMKGKKWYDKGRKLNKMNSFTDFIDCSRYLIINSYTNKKQLYAQGGSAGGLLMGTVMNLRPNLFNGIIAGVPFVDVVTTMLDDSIPLTTGEYDEWGNPNKKKYYQYMKSYSPYDNIKAVKYPNLLVTTGLHDSQVQYWEPAKWVAKLREYRKGDSTILLKTNMEAGHGGASGRDNRLKEKALEYSFIFALENITTVPKKGA